MVKHLKTITETTGFNTNLLDQMVALQIDGMIKECQASA